MIGLLKGRHISKVDEVLYEQKYYTDKQIKWLIDNYGDKLPVDQKSKKKKK